MISMALTSHLQGIKGEERVIGEIRMAIGIEQKDRDSEEREKDMDLEKSERGLEEAVASSGRTGIENQV